MKKATTEDRLDAALQRIIDGASENISSTTRLSVSSVEKEACLGNGSAYHYPDLIDKIKTAISEKTGKPIKSKSMSSDKEKQLRARIEDERRLKEKYRDEVAVWKERAQSLAAQLHEVNAAPNDAV
jgi:hypothetical protein